MDTMQRRTSLLAITAILAGMMSFASATPAQACSARGVRSGLRSGALAETIGLRTYNLDVRPDKKSYKVGDTAKVHVTVTRPAKEDPLGEGIPIDSPENFPAEGVNVGIGLRVGDVFLFGHNVTDAEGKTIVKVKIASYAPPGKASADAFAWKTAVDSPCARVEENGYTSIPNMFTVLRSAR
jgi:hypothetical protein